MNEDRLEKDHRRENEHSFSVAAHFWTTFLPSFLCEKSIRTLTARCGKICLLIRMLV